MKVNSIKDSQRLRRALKLSMVAILFVIQPDLPAAQNLETDLRDSFEIRDVIAMQGSETHLYVLSESEGLAVFRAYPDSLQWLYTSSGMQQRGDQLHADIRFAYLTGDSRRLTVIEPTSVLGVYSSTFLPERPRAAVRTGTELYTIYGESSLARLSLETPGSVDSDPAHPHRELLESSSLLDIASDRTGTLFVLQDDGLLLHLQREEESDNMDLVRRLQLDRTAEKLFLTGGILYATSENGELFQIESDGATQLILEAGEPIDKVESWNESLVIRTAGGALWIVEPSDTPRRWRDSENGGAHFTIASGRLWISENNRVSPVTLSQQGFSESAVDEPDTGTLSLKPVRNITIPFPQPLLIPIYLEVRPESGEVDFSWRAGFENASIRGNSFYWRPSASQTGRHDVTIVATASGGERDSVNFNVDVRTFNAPPRFTPQQPLTINFEE
ncbi:MAG: cadherin repeat domain-containing protein, partial [Balneolaceae bacterium]